MYVCVCVCGQLSTGKEMKAQRNESPEVLGFRW